MMRGVPTRQAFRVLERQLWAAGFHPNGIMRRPNRKVRRMVAKLMRLYDNHAWRFPGIPKTVADLYAAKSEAQS